MSYEQLYCENLPVVLKATEREDRHVRVKVTVIVQYTISPVHKKELLIRLTDDCDPFFLYTITLGDEDFQGLKLQQGLLVDFSAFPQKFIDLLNLCLNEDGKPSPKFLLQFILGGAEKQGESHLNVVETNPFKHLIHLSLLLSPGTDSDVKKYLAECLKHFKNRNCEVEKNMGDLNADLASRLAKTQEALSERTKEFESLKTDWASRTQHLTAKHAEETNTEKEKSLRIQVDLQRRIDQEKKDVESSYQMAMRQLELRTGELESSNRELTDSNYRAESRIRDYTSRLTLMEEESTRMKNELQALRRDNSELSSGTHDQEKTNNNLRTRVAVLEQEVKDKDQVIDKTTALLESSQQQMKHVENSCEQKQANVSKQDMTIKTMSEELMKANEIIRKLQGELKSVLAKMKLKNAVTTQQEKRINEKEQGLDKMKHDLDTVKENYKHTCDENEKLQDSLLTTTQKLEESRQLLKTNENVINWLNKQINEVQLQQHKPMGPGTFELSSQAGSRSSRVTYNPNTYSSAGAGVGKPSQGYMQQNPPPHSTQAYIPAVGMRQSPTNLLPGVNTSTPANAYSDRGPAPTTSPVVSAATTGVPGDLTSHSEPALDMKYLQRHTEGAVSVRGVGSRVGGFQTQPPRTGNNPPLMSAYFPPGHSQSKT